MRESIRKAPVALSLLLTFVISACGNTATSTPMSQPPATSIINANEADESEPSLTEEAVIDPELSRPDIRQSKFDNSTKIDNKYFPMTPGTKFVFEGVTEEAGNTYEHSIVYYVTDLTKEIMGIQTVVAWILDFNNGELVEAEIAFYAQDNEGNVWFMGEHPEVYEEGKLIEAPTWIPGIRGAEAGIAMKANPQLNQPSYAQGWGPAVGWTDRGHVVGIGEHLCVPVDCYENVLITEEFSQSEPNAFQVKYYAPGVGNIKVGWRGDDATHEELELTELTILTSVELAEVHTRALELEAHAYEISKEVYDQTIPSK